MNEPFVLRRVCAWCVGMFLVLALAASAEAEKPVKVFLLGGQSNMAGSGQTGELQAPYNVPFEKTPIWSPKQKKWAPLTPQAVNPGGRFGPEISFGRAIAAALPGEEIRLIKYAVGGTALYNDWAPTGGGQYRGFMLTANAALANLKASSTEYEIAGMLWLQGESDAHENKGQDYEKNLTAFITHMRQQFKSPNMPFIIARVRSHYGGATGHAKLVRDAQVTVAKEMKHVKCFDTDDLPMRDAGHYNGAGLIEIGKRFAAGSIAVLKPSDSEQADVDGELRQWTYKTGKSVEAALVGIEDDRVKLEKEDGQILSVAIKRLSDADQEFLKQQSAAD